MRLIHSILFLSAALCLHGQGNVNFANVGVGLNSPFLDGTAGLARLGAGTWSIELLAGPDAANLATAGPVYVGSFANGYFNAGQRTVSNVIGSSAAAQVRVWDNMGGTVPTWAQATVRPGVRWGQSMLFTIGLTQPPATPATMVNMPSVTVGVPEPSTLVMGLLGAVGALFFRRRRCGLSGQIK